ncbi:MAG: rod shape-determining protein MreC [Alphaproteobacteria bacterium]
MEKGQAVLSGDGLIGRIIEAGQKTSRILLLTDMNSRVPVLVENTSQHAILAGDNGPYAKLLLVSTDSEITEGSRIVTSGHGGLFPKGLPVGMAVKTADERIVVQPYADFNRIVYVRIIDQPDDPNLRRGSFQYGSLLGVFLF